MLNDGSEVVVIGSGFGGSATAGRLAEAGVKVTVLERGPWRDTLPTRSMGIEPRVAFPRGFAMYFRLLRNVGGNRGFSWNVGFSKTGLFELFFGSGVNVVASSNVGGGSHVYSAIHCKPAMEDYWDGHAEEVSSALMEQYYQSVLERLGSVAPTPEHRMPNTTRERYAGDRILEPAVPYAQARLGYLLPSDPGNPQVIESSGIRRQEVDYQANDDGFLGSPGGGKTTLDVAYLWPGIQSGNLTVRDMSEVLRITSLGKSSGARYEVKYRDLRSRRQKTIRTRHVVMAAGTLNTLKLLLSSRHAGGLTGMPRLGYNFGANGDFLAFWDCRRLQVQDLSAGLPTRGGFRLRGDDQSAIFGGGAFPSIDDYPLPERVKRRFKQSLLIAGIGTDSMDGWASFDTGRFALHFDASKSPVFEKAWGTADAIAKRTGMPMHYRRVPTTVHPLGGAGLGRDAMTGVINANGEVFENPGLFVTDASAFPTSLGAPPTLSIAAWAEHVANCFIESRGKN